MPGPILGLGLTLVSLIGFGINLYILAVVLLAKQVWVENAGLARILLAQLGITGFFISTTFLATNTMMYFNAAPFFPCPVSVTAIMVLHPMALFSIAMFNFDRYLAIAAPLHYSSLVKPKKALIMMVMLAGTVSTSLAIFPLMFAEYKYDSDNFMCRPDFRTRGGFVFVCFYTVVTFIVPVGIVIFCNTKILMIARYHRHRIAQAIFEVTLSAQVTITHQKNPFLLPQGSTGSRHRSATTSILQITISLLVFYSLSYILLLLQSLGFVISNESVDQQPQVGCEGSVGHGSNSLASGRYSSARQSSIAGLIYRLSTTAPTVPSKTLFYTSLALQVISAPYNAFLYGLKNKILRRAFRHYWRKKMTECEFDQEIQARTPSRRPSVTTQRVGRPASTGFIGQTPRAQGILRHSATSASLLVTHKVHCPSKKRSKPMILVTKPGSEVNIELGLAGTSRYKLGGSASSVSGDSDVTQEDWGTPNWHFSASSTSLPTVPPKNMV